MKHFLMLLLGLGGISGIACKAHQHGLEADTEIVMIDLTSGLG